MTVFSVHDEDGKITQSNKVFMPEGYADTLRERDWKFVEHRAASHANLQREFVWHGSLAERPKMRASINRYRIKVGDNDAARIVGIPSAARVDVYAGGTPFFSGPVEGSSIEFSAPVPGTYTIVIVRWPYRDWQAQVVAQ